MQISIINGSVEYDGIPVLSQVDFCIRDKEKIALVGRNGCGKTTLLKALTGEVELVAGVGDENFGYFVSGSPVIGFLKQTNNDNPSITMEEELLSAYSDILSVEKRMEEALSLLEKDSSEKNSITYGRLHDEFERLGGYYYKKEYLTAVRKFGFSDDDLKKSLTEFSGGQRTKIALLKLLLSRPDLLLLDEPTNHLDLEAIEWLEKYLSEYKKSIVIVSHDRMFLDKIVTVVYEIEYGETTRYAGNYTSFCAQKRVAYDKAYKDAMMRKKEIERLSKLVEKFRYKASKAAFAQAKLTQIKRIGEINIPMGYDNSTFKASFQPTEETVRETLVLENLVFGYSQDKPLGNLSFMLEKGQKLGIIGSNGCGKSTLVKTLIGKVKALDGCSYFGLHSNIGYFDQTLTQSFSGSTVLEDFLNEFPQYTGTEARTALGAFLFSGDDVFKRVGDLSGGEKVRLALCKIFRHRPNVLILDEPTNHMDIIGKDTLENMLSAYEGTVITVSHDRYFINRICDRLVVFEEGNAKFFVGGYTAYEEEMARRNSIIEDGLPKENKKEQKKGKPISESKERARRQHRIGVLEDKISALDVEISALKKRLAEDPSVYTDYKKIAEITAEIEQLTGRQEPYIEEWTILQEEEDK